MNNRQNGRRRGRNNNNNNNRPQSGGGRGGTDQANRIDSRARGNAAQMIEKFKNLARDAQLSGDRVQTEYYLQFADHYFRVHSDFRARQEEKNGGQHDRNDRREVRGVEDFDAHDETDLDEVPADQDEGRDDNRGDRGDRDNRNERNDRQDRGDRNERGDRGERSDRNPNRGNRRDENDDNRGNRQPARERAERPERAEVEARDEDVVVEDAKPARAPRRGVRRPRDEDEGGAGIDSAVLPPAIGRPAPMADADDGEAAEAAPKPRKRRTLAARSSDVEAAE